MLELNRRRVGADVVRHVHADIFSWKPDEAYDVVFFGFWLSHVPPAEFESFWSLVDTCLVPGGRVLFLDSLYDSASSAKDHTAPDPASVMTRRRLNDGDEFDIVKVFYEPSELATRLRALGWAITVDTTSRFFLYGHGGRSSRM
jgi:demethylmenaquinone methyltransferase/2-methoxy-6-polyprenyl-1,4-benzoquinol methylase